MAEKKPKIIVEHVPIASLKPFPVNSRIHPEEQITALMESLRLYGQIEPFIVQRSTSYIIGGHGRIEAMLRRGETHCDITRLNLTDEQARDLNIRLNRLSEMSKWDADALTIMAGEGTNLDAFWNAEELGEIFCPVDVFQDDDAETKMFGYGDAESEHQTDFKTRAADNEQRRLERHYSQEEKPGTKYECPACGYIWTGKRK